MECGGDEQRERGTGGSAELAVFVAVGIRQRRHDESKHSSNDHSTSGIWRNGRIQCPEVLQQVPLHDVRWSSETTRMTGDTWGQASPGADPSDDRTGDRSMHIIREKTTL